ncbi:MAG: hypothetical protein PUJ07_03735 [Eubacteriales bacterium]|nr:hypothetical protein [Eubacteriales bacterium]
MMKTTEIGYFNRENIPQNLAVEKTSYEQIMVCFDAYENSDLLTLFD